MSSSGSRVSDAGSPDIGNMFQVVSTYWKSSQTRLSAPSANTSPSTGAALSLGSVAASVSVPMYGSVGSLVSNV